jgi:hypothetical protein
MKKKGHTRRSFLKNGATLVAASTVAPLTTLLPTVTALTSTHTGAIPASPPASPNQLIGIQVGPESFVDEGTDKLLDLLQQTAAINAISLTTFTYGQGFAGRLPAGHDFPGHGKIASEGKPFHGGNFATPHPTFYAHTILKNTRAPDHGDLDILAEVLPAAKKRGMKLFCGIEDRWDKAFDVPGLKECAEIDLMGRSTFDPSRSISTCVFHPDIRAFWTGLVTDLCSSYPIDGLLFENERSGPLMNVLGATPFRKGVGDTSHVACFCEHHRQAALQRNIDFDRAKQGYLKLVQFVQAALKDQRPPDGYYVTFQEILMEFPEILAYDRLCDSGKLQVVSEIRSAMKAVRSDLQLIFHIEQTISFNPVTRAALSYEKLADMADFLKPATYNNCAGERYANFIHNIGSTVFRDLPPEEIYQSLNHFLNYDGMPPLNELPTAGLPATYISKETQRAIAMVKGKCGILTGIDVNVPVGPGSRQASPEDTYTATLAALQAGAQGVILSRKYSEMRLANLASAGKAIRFNSSDPRSH